MYLRREAVTIACACAGSKCIHVVGPVTRNRYQPQCLVALFQGGGAVDYVAPKQVNVK